MMKLQAFTRPIQGAYREGMSFTLLIDVVDAHCVFSSIYLFIDPLFIYVCMHAYVHVYTHRYRTGRMNVGEVMLLKGGLRLR